MKEQTMRNLALVFWLTIPVAAWAYHRGPGQERLVLDDAGRVLAEADRQAAAGQWADAVAGYEEALALLPVENVDATRRVRLQRAKAQLQIGQLPPAYDDLTAFVDEAQRDPDVDPALLDDARRSLANAQYYLTWLMRLEGEPEAAWGPEIEAARQSLRLLSEQNAQGAASDVAESHREDLEAAIRLARMDLHELQALPLPCQCKGCCSGQCKCKGKKPGRKPGKGQKPPEDVRSAGSGPPPDNGGS
jgi:tetratricopeptide (TPR) repeat protein